MSATHRRERGLTPGKRRGGLVPLVIAVVGVIAPVTAVAQEAIEAELGAPGFLRRLSAGLMQTLAELTPADESLGRTQRLLERNQEAIERLDRRPVLSTACLPGGNDMVLVRYCPPGASQAQCTQLSYSCAPMQCTDGRCRGPAWCQNNADCGASGRCNPDTGACVPLAYDGACDGGSPYTGSNATMEFTCAPYQCRAGTCRSECVTSADCVDDYECCGQKCVRAGQGC